MTQATLTRPACQSQEILNLASDLEVFVFYADYLLHLLNKACPKELTVRLVSFIHEIDESDLSMGVKEHAMLSLQEILNLLVRAPSALVMQEVELRLSRLKAYMASYAH